MVLCESNGLVNDGLRAQIHAYTDFNP